MVKEMDLSIWLSELLNEFENVKIDKRVLHKYLTDFLNDNKLELKIKGV